MPNYNGVWSLTTQLQYVSDWPSPPSPALFGTGSDAATYSTVIEKVNMATAGNAVDFGDLTQGRYRGGALGSATRAVFGGGVADLSAGDGNNESDVMDYVTIATSGNATDFGNLTQKRQALAGLSNSTRGVFCGGYSGSKFNIMDYITIGSTGNATDFGDLINARLAVAACASTTRGLIGGGDAASTTDEIDYITIGSTGNGFAGIYMDASNGDFIGSDYVFIGQDNDKTFRLEAFSSAGDILLRESGTDTLRLSSGNADFTGDVLAQGLYVGSANTSFDFYNNGTTYLNGATTIDDNLTISGSSVGITIINNAETDAGILMYDGQDAGQQASIKYGSGDNALKFFNSTTERMRIGSNGYIGMGITNNSNQRLTLAEADSNGSHIKMNNSRSGGGYFVMGVGDSGSNSAIVPAGGLFFYNGATRMVINSSGRVGVATTSPDETLQVVGSVQFGVDGAVSDDGKLKIRNDGDSFISMVRSGYHTWRHMITSAGTYILRDVDNGVNPIEITESDCIETNVPVIGTNIGRNNDDQVLFAITEHDTSESIRRKFGNTSLTAITKVDDSTAPADGCFQLTNQYYSVTVPEFFKVDNNKEYTFEVWVKFVSGSDTTQMLYAGSSFYDSGKNYLGNTQRYWGASAVQVDANSRSDGNWYHISGTLGPNRGTNHGDFPKSAEWMKLILLLNYSNNV